MPKPMPLRSFLLAAALGLGAWPATAQASPQLRPMEAAVLACLESSSPSTCDQANRSVAALRKLPSYAKASHLCREEITELQSILKLLPEKDVLANEVMAGVDDLKDACAPYGF